MLSWTFLVYLEVCCVSAATELFMFTQAAAWSLLGLLMEHTHTKLHTYASWGELLFDGCEAQPKYEEDRRIKKAKTDRVVGREDDCCFDVSLDIQKELYEQYRHVKAGLGARSKVNESVHSYIIEHLRAWQRKYNKGEFERPCQTHWYWNLRVKLIQEGRLSTSHCKDVCRNSIKNQLDKKQQD